MEVDSKQAKGRRNELLWAALACCLIVLIWAPSARADGWLSPDDLSAAGKSASNAELAMSDSGEAVAIWQRFGFIDGGVYFATRSPGGGFSGVAPLAPGAESADLAIDDGGTAVAVWRRLDVGSGNYLIQTATRPSGGSFSSPVDVAAVDGSIPQDLGVAVNDDGDVAVVWTETVDVDETNSVSVVMVSVRPNGGSFSTPARISPVPAIRQVATSPRVDLSADGSAIVVWRYDNGVDTDEDYVIQAATRPPSGPFTVPEPISVGGDDVGVPVVAVAPDGETAALWLRLDSASSNNVLQAAVRPAGAGFAAPVDVSDPSEFAFRPDVAIAPDGEAVATWASQDGSESRVQAAVRPPGGAFGGPSDLSDPSSDTRNPSVVLNDDGDAVAVWQRSNGSHQIVQAATRSSGGGFSSPDDLSGSGGDAVGPAVGIDADGGAAVAWARNSVVQAAGYDTQDPEVDNLSVPASAVVRQPVDVSAEASDDWGVASTGFSFGDGATADGTSASHTYSAPGSYRVEFSAEDEAGGEASTSASIQILASNAFGFRKLFRLHRLGRAILVVRVAGSGRVVLVGRGLRTIVRGARKAGNVRLPVVPKRWLLRRLNRRHRAKIGIRVIFNPRGGPAARKARPLVLVKKRRPRSRGKARNRARK